MNKTVKIITHNISIQVPYNKKYQVSYPGGLSALRYVTRILMLSLVYYILVHTQVLLRADISGSVYKGKGSNPGLGLQKI